MGVSAQPINAKSQSPNKVVVSHNEVRLSNVLIVRLWRIDCILTPSFFQSYIQECYTGFVAGANHKELSLSTITESGHCRKCCRDTCLHCNDTIPSIDCKLRLVSATGYTGWEDPLSLNRSASFTYKRTHKTAGMLEALAVPQEYTIHKLAPCAEGFVLEKGYTMYDPPTASRIICAISEQTNTDRMGLVIVDKIHTANSDLHSSQPWR